MAETNKFKLQFLRNKDAYENRAAAVQGLNGLTGNLLIGEPAIAIYNEGDTQKVLLGIKLGESKGIQIFEGATFDVNGNIQLPDAVQAAIDGVNAKITTLNGDAETEGSVAKKIKDATDPINEKINTLNGDNTVAGSVDKKIKDATDPIQEAIDTLNGAVTEEGSVAKAVKDAVDALDYADAAPEGETWEGQVVTGVTQTDGVIAVSHAKLGAANVTAEAIAAGDNTVAVEGTDVAAQIASLAGTLKTVENNAAKYKVVAITGDDLTALGANVKEAYKVVSYVGADAEGTTYTQVGETIKIYKDASLVSVTPTADTNGANTVITFVYNLADGKQETVAVDLGKAIFESEMGNGMQVTDSKIAIKLDEASEDFLTVGEGGLKLAGVQGAIEDVADTAAAGKYVSQVSQTDGKIAVERADVAAAVLNGYAKGEDATAVAATDTINGAISKLENQVDAAKTAITTEIQKLDVSDTAVDGKFVTAVSETDGMIEVTRGEVAAKYVTLTEVGEKDAEGDAVENGVKLEAANVQDFAQEIFNKTIENEQVAANAINAIVTVLGSDVAKKGEKIEFNPEYFANTFVNGATSFADALFKLAKKMEVIDCGTY